MVLETTVICLDNSEYSRNGDYIPNRLAMQRECVIEVCGAKHQDNPENALALISSAGDRVLVRVTPTQDIGRILQGLHEIEPDGYINFIKSIQTAQLALKHRMHKNHSQRIIVFVGSKIEDTEKDIEVLGKSLKKNNISLDIVSFGDTSVNYDKLQLLHSTIGSKSVFVQYPPEKAHDIMYLFSRSPIISNKGEHEDLNEENSEYQRYLLCQLQQQERGGSQYYDREEEEVAEAIFMSLNEFCEDNARNVTQTNDNIQRGSQEVLGGGDVVIIQSENLPLESGDERTVNASYAVTPEQHLRKNNETSKDPVELLRTENIEGENKSDNQKPNEEQESTSQHIQNDDQTQANQQSLKVEIIEDENNSEEKKKNDCHNDDVSMS